MTLAKQIQWPPAKGPAILTHLIKKPSQVTLGTCYRIVGHSGRGLPIPPQVWQPRSRTLSMHTGLGIFKGPLYMVIGTKVTRFLDHQVPFDDIGVDGHQDEFHDMHLEFGPSNQATISGVLGDRSYPFIQQDLRKLALGGR